MQVVTTVGLDIAKSVFQVHGVDAAGQVVIRRQLKRRYVLAFFEKLPPCLVGIEACASSHHWSRELKTLGHTVRLMPPAYVKPYVKRQKNDAADAEAICEAVTRANMRFVATKTPEQQSGLSQLSLQVIGELTILAAREIEPIERTEGLNVAGIVLENDVPGDDRLLDVAEYLFPDRGDPDPDLFPLVPVFDQLRLLEQRFDQIAPALGAGVEALQRHQRRRVLGLDALGAAEVLDRLLGFLQLLVVGDGDDQQELALQRRRSFFFPAESAFSYSVTSDAQLSRIVARFSSASRAGVDSGFSANARV